MNRYCQNCQFTDGIVYTSLPPKIRCLITNEFHNNNYECDVEFAPVKSGKWVWNKNNFEYKCSACEMTFDYDKTYELFDHGFMLANYCPYCGAKMSGEET